MFEENVLLFNVKCLVVYRRYLRSLYNISFGAWSRITNVWYVCRMNCILRFVGSMIVVLSFFIINYLMRMMWLCVMEWILFKRLRSMLLLLTYVSYKYLGTKMIIVSKIINCHWILLFWLMTFKVLTALLPSLSFISRLTCRIIFTVANDFVLFNVKSISEKNNKLKIKFRKFCKLINTRHVEERRNSMVIHSNLIIRFHTFRF